jgi:hypothetical protein
MLIHNKIYESVFELAFSHITVEIVLEAQLFCGLFVAFSY